MTLQVITYNHCNCLLFIAKIELLYGIEKDFYKKLIIKLK